ncbi:hypothetical protein T03_10048 [Trichinella britovi]|uniref:Uncharacterized protein n=1 Tax=Trichinella britovi TaxID=45882 RepID=A0A0V1C915_TRIBR|nr:hypothetical protein T03_10048 [Trichinella britovi]
MTERLCYGNRTNSLRQTAKKTGSGVTDWLGGQQPDECGSDEEVQLRKSLSCFLGAPAYFTHRIPNSPSRKGQCVKGVELLYV